MGATRRSCVKAAVLAVVLSAALSAMLPGCQFPTYGVASSTGGNAGTSTTGGSSGDDLAGAAGAAADAGSDAGAGSGEGGTGAAGGSPGGAGGMDTPPPPCDQTCVPRAPRGWSGPVAFWEDQAGVAIPACPSGFNDPKPADVHRELFAPDGVCSCTCAPAEGQICDATLHLFLGQACDGPCASVSTRSCAAVSAACTGTQGTTSVDNLTISGGSCKPQVVQPVDPVWKYNDRLCKSTDLGTCADANQVCARSPEYPYLTSLCVTRQISGTTPLPMCPEEYPRLSNPLYGSYTDGRTCSECVCGAPTGGTCTGKVTISAGSDCGSPLGEYVLGSPSNCQKFDLGGGGLRPTHVIGQYTANPPGSCTVTSKSEPMGTATPSGMITVVCCQN